MIKKTKSGGSYPCTVLQNGSDDAESKVQFFEHEVYLVLIFFSLHSEEKVGIE